MRTMHNLGGGSWKVDNGRSVVIVQERTKNDSDNKSRPTPAVTMTASRSVSRVSVRTKRRGRIY